MTCTELHTASCISVDKRDLRNFDSCNSVAQFPVTVYTVSCALCRYDSRCLTLHLYLNCCSCPITNVPVPDHTNFCQVIIVGAGIAGLAAAKTLIENGVKDIRIVEGKQDVTVQVLTAVLVKMQVLWNMVLTGTVLKVQAAHCSETLVQAIQHGIILHKL